jgi:hypothetical protein
VLPMTELPKEETKRRARKLREDGGTIRSISANLNCDSGYVLRLIGGQRKGEAAQIPVAANDNKIVRMIAHNGGCSTRSGFIAVSVPRIPTLEKPEIQVAA